MIEITNNAAAQIHKMLAKRGSAETGLRVGVKAGGCSGFEYTFGWEREPKATDVVFEGDGGARVYVDPRSLRVLDGSVLDYDTSLLSKGSPSTIHTRPRPAAAVSRSASVRTLANEHVD
jgi:iron-sulfur cluster assembly protein